jgi:hypothetical protein
VMAVEAMGGCAAVLIADLRLMASNVSFAGAAKGRGLLRVTRPTRWSSKPLAEASGASAKWPRNRRLPYYRDGRQILASLVLNKFGDHRYCVYCIKRLRSKTRCL